MNILDATCEKLKTSLSPFIFAKKVAILNNQGYFKNIFIYKELINFYSKKSVFTTHFEILIPISLQPNIVDLRYLTV